MYHCDGGGGRGGSLLWSATGWGTMAGPVSLALKLFKEFFAEKATLFGCFRACYLGFD